MTTTPTPTQPPAVVPEAQIVADICQAVAELPDRNSPEDWPEAMLVTHEELAAIVRDALSAAAQAAAPTTEQAAPGYPHEQMDAMALARYKVVPAHESMLHSHAVVAGDGTSPLYIGREKECQNMARKFAGAFLDGAFAFHSLAAPAPTTEQAGSDCDEERCSYCDGTGDVHDLTGEWRGTCHCPAGQRENARITTVLAAPGGEAPAPAAPTDKMVDAYLSEQRRVVEEADRFGRPNVGGLHTNTVREACRAGIAAAMAAQSQKGAA